jgi:tRNA G46 methylase TrmB
LPLVPKRWWPSVPYNRTSYNEFILWIKSLGLTSASWVIDVGANHGDFAQAASTVFPDAKILLIEPVSTLHAELKRR